MQSGDTETLKAARAKAAEVRALMKNMTEDERVAHKQAKADEKKEKAKARYAAQKAEKLRQSLPPGENFFNLKCKMGFNSLCE